MADPWDSGYKPGSAHQSSGLFGGSISVAIAAGTNDVYFRADNGLGDWTAPPVFIAAIDIGSKKVQVRMDNGTIIVSNQIDWHYKSEDYGRTWEPIPE